MKKNYFEPKMAVIELDLRKTILAGSVPGAEGGGSDGGVTPTTDDPSTPGWGDDF